MLHSNQPGRACLPTSSALLLIVALVGTTSALASPSVGDVWSSFRGPLSTGQATEGLLPNEAFGLSVQWRQELGSGYSNISIADGRVYTLFTSGDVDVMAAFDEVSGRELWRYEIGPKYAGHDGSQDGPHSTPNIDRGVAYVVGPHGQVVAVRSETGEKVWQYDLTEENSTTPIWGYATSPLVKGDTVLVATGGEGHMITALDRITGEPKWMIGDDAVSYQTPSLLEIAGREVLVASTDFYLQGLDLETGEILWQTRHFEGNNEGDTSGHVISAGDGRFLVNHYRGAKLYQATADSVEVVWESRAFANSLAIPVLIEDHFYGFTRNILTCIEASSGEIVWRSREPGGLGLAAVDGALSIVDEDGNLVLVDASPDGYRELTRVNVFEEGSYAFPSFSNGAFVVRNLTHLASVGIDTGLRPEVPTTEVTDRLKGEFGTWIERVESLDASERQAAVDEYFSSVEATPLLEGESLVHFVWRGEAEDVALSGVTGVPPDPGPEVVLERLAGTDLFFTSIELISDAQYNYALSIDYEDPGVDENNPYRVDEGGNGLFSDLRMPNWPPSPHLDVPAEDAPRGSMDTFQFTSNILESTRQIQVWRPADYGSDPEKRYPLLVVNHGDGHLLGGLMNNVLDNMVGTSVEPLIALFVPRVAGPEFGGALADSYNRFLVEELLPHIDQHYRTDGERRAIMGNGSAAVAALYAALKHQDVFQAAALQSFYPVEPVHGQLAELVSGAEPSSTDVLVMYSNRDYDLGGGVLAETTSKELLEQLEQASFETGELVSQYSPTYGGWRGLYDDILLRFFPLSAGEQ